jgi:hypothetical protein
VKVARVGGDLAVFGGVPEREPRPGRSRRARVLPGGGGLRAAAPAPACTPSPTAARRSKRLGCSPLPRDPQSACQRGRSGRDRAAEEQQADAVTTLTGRETPRGSGTNPVDLLRAELPLLHDGARSSKVHHSGRGLWMACQRSGNRAPRSSEPERPSSLGAAQLSAGRQQQTSTPPRRAGCRSAPNGVSRTGSSCLALLGLPMAFHGKWLMAFGHP